MSWGEGGGRWGIFRKIGPIGVKSLFSWYFLCQDNWDQLNSVSASLPCLLAPRASDHPLCSPLLPRSCLLQADSERLLQLWVSAVQSSIATAFSQARLDDSPRGPGQVPSRGGCRARRPREGRHPFPRPHGHSLSTSGSPRARDTWPGAPRRPWAVAGWPGEGSPAELGTWQPRCRAWMAMPSAVTAVSQPRSGPASTWASPSASSAPASTGHSPPLLPAGGGGGGWLEPSLRLLPPTLPWLALVTLSWSGQRSVLA